MAAGSRRPGSFGPPEGGAAGCAGHGPHRPRPASALLAREWEPGRALGSFARGPASPSPWALCFPLGRLLALGAVTGTLEDSTAAGSSLRAPQEPPAFPPRGSRPLSGGFLPRGPPRSPASRRGVRRRRGGRGRRRTMPVTIPQEMRFFFLPVERKAAGSGTRGGHPPLSLLGFVALRTSPRRWSGCAPWKCAPAGVRRPPRAPSAGKESLPGGGRGEPRGEFAFF